MATASLLILGVKLSLPLSGFLTMKCLILCLISSADFLNETERCSVKVLLTISPMNTGPSWWQSTAPSDSWANSFVCRQYKKLARKNLACSYLFLFMCHSTAIQLNAAKSRKIPSNWNVNGENNDVSIFQNSLDLTMYKGKFLIGCINWCTPTSFRIFVRNLEKTFQLLLDGRMHM